MRSSWAFLCNRGLMGLTDNVDDSSYFWELQRQLSSIIMRCGLLRGTMDHRN
jgi:hypothetical protein